MNTPEQMHLILKNNSDIANPCQVQEVHVELMASLRAGVIVTSVLGEEVEAPEPPCRDQRWLWPWAQQSDTMILPLPLASEDSCTGHSVKMPG